ncbi:acyl-CoA dehydrogenase family protein [Intrasporangium sp.]|uniref:acyl-CoA dehydrogenase family protein n=1 Tax=Intrasporangium sp. TaxID=1925024 RepID=UPI00293A5CBE|nr:acyl-CoA dehydrogenase family protein [Intrasporangium sp.]MDV3221654.1 acyl-CoA dehydrogenase family protein [Intrasporangium sp.]
MALNHLNLADRGQRLGLRLITRAGSLPLLGNREVRRTVEHLLYRGSKGAFGALDAASRRSFPARPGTGDPTRSGVAARPREFDLTPSEDQEMIRSAAASLADEVIRPAGAGADGERAVPEGVTRAAAALGLPLIAVPVDLGGIAEERSAVTTALVIEELARGDLGIATALMAPAAVAAALANYGTSAQQATYLPAFTGEDLPAVASLALMEPHPLFDPLAPRTTAVARGSDLVLNGAKSLVVGAAGAELLVVSALVDGAPRLVIVETGARGLTVEDDPAMGIRAAATGRVVLDDVVVPAANLLGTSADHLDAVRRARLAWAAAACGTAQAALDQLGPYVTSRQAFGEPIAHRQAVAFTVADVAIELAGLRLVVWRAAARLDQGKEAGQLIAHARQLTARHGAQIGSHAVQLLGGHGFVKEFDNERWYRDLRGAGVLEGVLLV